MFLKLSLRSILILLFVAQSTWCGYVIRPTEYVWPPIEYERIFDNLKPICMNRTGVESETIREFSETDDLDHLPNSRELQCYMSCLFVVANHKPENSTSFNYPNMIDTMNTLPRYSHTIILRMASDCFKHHKELDACENAYKVHVCLKTKDKQHYVIY